MFISRIILSIFVLAAIAGCMVVDEDEIAKKVAKRIVIEEQYQKGAEAAQKHWDSRPKGGIVKFDNMWLVGGKPLWSYEHRDMDPEDYLSEFFKGIRLLNKATQTIEYRAYSKLANIYDFERLKPAEKEIVYAVLVPIRKIKIV